VKRPEKITFGEMREMGVIGVLVCCLDCSRLTAINADRWPDQIRLSEPKFTCQACGSRGADVRPDFVPTYKRPRVIHRVRSGISTNRIS
jgi:hypothetical protein